MLDAQQLGRGRRIGVPARWRQRRSGRLGGEAPEAPASGAPGGSLGPETLAPERVAQPVGHEVEGEHGEEDGQTGEDQGQGAREDVPVGLGEHEAPTGRRGLLAQAEKAQTGVDEDGVAEGQGHLDDERGGHIGQDVRADQAPRWHAGGPGRLDVILLPNGDHLAPDQSDEAGHEHDGDGDGGVVQVGTEQAGHGQGQDERGEREEGVHGPHHHDVDPAPYEAGHQGQRQGQHQRSPHDLEGGPQRRPGAEDEPAEHVAAEVVGAEPVRPRRPGVDAQEILHVGSVGGEQGGGDGHEDHADDEDEPTHGHLVAGETPQGAAVLVDSGVGRLVRRRPRGGAGADDERVTAAGGQERAHARRTFGLR